MGTLTMTDYDPTLSPKEAAKYLGLEHPRTLARLNVERTPIPCTGKKRPRYGYRLSVLNELRERFADPRSRKDS